jgi:citrate lyase acyl carrier protein
MVIKTNAVAGTMESSDIMITVGPSLEPGISVDLKSSVLEQFGDQIRDEIIKVMREHKVDRANVTAVDRGALDCTVRARVATALYRACACVEEAWNGGSN